jgi:hypothetical protein
MKLTNIFLLPLALIGTVAAGPGRRLAAGSGGCLAGCTAALVTCHAAGHSMSIFTFGVTSIIAFATCHNIFFGCEAACMTGVAVNSARK